MLNIIVAYDDNRAIGVDGDLPWGRSLPADLAHFSRLTRHSTVIMGRKTFESIGRPLPERNNIVISRSEEPLDERVTQVASLALALTYQSPDTPTFVIGGGEIYRQALSMTARIHATEVHHRFASTDVFFPELDTTLWHETERTDHQADNNNRYDHTFVMYERKNNRHMDGYFR